MDSNRTDTLLSHRLAMTSFNGGMDARDWMHEEVSTGVSICVMHRPAST